MEKGKTVTLELSLTQAHLVRMALEGSLRVAKLALEAATGTTRQVVGKHVAEIEELLLMPFSQEDVAAEFKQEHEKYLAIMERVDDIRKGKP